jgi:osmoprotectant transport system substrate-binding protein
VRRWEGRLVGLVSAAAVVSMLAACTASAPPSPAGPPSGQRPIIVASFGFTENEILAQLYAQALEAKGYPVRLMLDAGPRELLQPALTKGLVDLVPEYAGSALSFLTLGAEQSGLPSNDARGALFAALAPKGLVPLAPASAQDANAIVVTEATAERYGLRTVSDLGSVAWQLVFGGPPECPQRPMCLPGLSKVYGVDFADFVPLDVGGPLTLQALRSGAIDVALLFTTDPSIAANRLVVLTDDRRLQPSENVTPVIRQAVLTDYGSGVETTIDAVSALLTSVELTDLIRQVASDQGSPETVAARWLREHGLA